MNYSFYLSLWIITYLLIDILGGAALRQNSFFLAILIVWLLTAAVNRWCAPTLAAMARRRRLRLCEAIYQGDPAGIVEGNRQQFSMQAMFAAYMVVVCICFLLIPGQLAMFFIFGFFTFFSVKAALKSYAAYISVKTNIQAVVDQAKMSPDYQQFEQMRAQMPLRVILGPLTKGEKRMRISGLIFAILCFASGALETFYWYYLLRHVHGLSVPGLFINMSFGVLAIVIGVHDIIEWSKTRRAATGD